MKKILTITLTCLTFSVLSHAQDVKKYSHCNCEEISQQNGPYLLNSNGVNIESGQKQDGKRHGQWITKTPKGTIIRKAQYSNGVLNGDYELFHFDGNQKLKAEFEQGLPKGNWQYFNAKGKIIKEGSFSSGKPVGIWTIYDQKGKMIYVQYDFDKNEEIVSAHNKQYFKKGGIIRDDQSGEWMLLYLPQRNIETHANPLGGYLLASDLFADYLNVPTVFMDTYAHYEFEVEVEINSGVTKVGKVNLIDNATQFDKTSHSLPFIVETNSPKKLKIVDHDDASINFLAQQIKEVVSITGPWTSKDFQGTIKIRVPFVVNKLIK